jgi:hypothetical protein
MTLSEIKAAVGSGKKVYWSNPLYVVEHDTSCGCDQWLIHCSATDIYIGLTWRDGVTLNGRPEQFYVEDK